MSSPSKLEARSLSYTSSLKSPIGIYLRREIYGKENRTDATLKKKLYEQTAASQSPDGSWNQLFVETANNLWNIALLGISAEDACVSKGLGWLKSIQTHNYNGYPGFFYSGNRKDASLMRSTFYGEFGPGCTIFYQTTYAMHLFHVFGLDDEKLQTAVRSYLRFWKPSWCGTWCTINVLRMLQENRLSAESKQVKETLNYLKERQTKTGTWRSFPFYHTFNALSRVNHDVAKEQLERAFPLVAKRQNTDGSWGRKESETETFLMLDALRNYEVNI